MAHSLIFNNMGEIHARLFDHKPVLQQEVGLFVREFEEKRGGREVKNLYKTLQITEQINTELLPTLTGNLCTLLPQISSTLAAANDISTAILQNNNSSHEDWLSSQQAERTKQWNVFMDGMCKKSADVDEEFNNDVHQTQQYYKQLEEKLKLAPSPHS